MRAVATALMALHGINGGVIVAMSGTLVARARRLARKDEPARASEPVGMGGIPRS